MSNTNTTTETAKTISTDANAKIEIVSKTPAVEQQLTLDGKLFQLVSDITGLKIEELLPLGFWVIASKDNLINSAMAACKENKTAPEIFDQLFKDAPVKPDYAVVMKNIEEKLISLLEIIAVKVDVWIGHQAGAKFRDALASNVAEFKKTGQFTKWSEKLDLIKSKTEGLINALPEEIQARVNELVESPEKEPVSLTPNKSISNMHRNLLS